MTVLEAAHDYIRRGWGVVPLYGYDAETQACRCRSGRLCPTKSQGKHPSSGSTWHDRALWSGADAQAWYEDHAEDNIGILTGAASGIFVVDVDGAEGIRSFSDLAATNGPLPPTRIVRTGSGGLHYYFRHPGHLVVHNSTSWLGPRIDVRGRHGQVVAPPSTSGRGAYELIADHSPADAPGWLVDLLAEHSAACEAGRSATVAGAQPIDIALVPERIGNLASTLIGVDQGRHTHFHGLVAACHEAGYNQGETVTIVAPWCAAVDKYVGRVEQEVARSWVKIQAATDKANEWVPGIAGPAPNSDDTAQPDQNPTETDDDTEPAGPEPTWQPVDLTDILAGTYTPEQASILPRTDGPCLIYPGRIHSLHGESESGKSLVAQAETARLVTAGHDVLYVDFESDAPAVVGRLRDLGASTDAIASHFTYIRPDTDPRRFDHERRAFGRLLERRYDLAIIDGMTDALGVFGASSKDNDEVSGFMRAVPRLITNRTGAAVVVIDHVAKDGDSRGRFAIGGQAKMAALDGAAYVVEITEPIGRGMRGTITLRIAKDRPGGIRPECGRYRPGDRTQEAARVVVDSTAGPIGITVEPPRGGVGDTAPAGPPRLTGYMERVSKTLEAAGRPLSKSELQEENGGNSKYVLTATQTLIEEGYLRVEDGPRNARMRVLVRPYREADDAQSDAYTGWADTTTRTTRTHPDHTQTKSSADDPDQNQCSPSEHWSGSAGVQNGSPGPDPDQDMLVACTKCFRPIDKTIADIMGGTCGTCAI